MNINYDWYKAFCRVAECGSITLAAEKLYISQPAVSQMIRQLEEAVGTPLFVRTPKGVRLTAEGEILYQHASAGLASFEEGERRVAAMLRLDAGEIRIGASDMTLEFCLLPHLERFHRQYPNVKITITNHPTPQTVALLTAGKIDFAAVSEPIPETDFPSVPVREIRDIFICSPTEILPENPSLVDFKDSLIQMEENTSTRTFVDEEFRRRGFYAVPKFELATSPQIVRFAAMGLGIGCVVADFANRAIADGEVREISVSDPLPPRHLCIVHNPLDIPRAARVLLDMICG